MMANHAQEDRIVRCPRCQSVRTRLALRGERSALVPFLRRNRTCKDCEYIFESPMSMVLSAVLVVGGVLLVWTSLNSLLFAWQNARASGADWFWRTSECIAGAYLVVVGTRFLLVVHSLRKKEKARVGQEPDKGG